MTCIRDVPDLSLQAVSEMLKCTMCGHVERCCHVLCPVCGERMVLLDKDGQVHEEKVGDPLYPSEVGTQCRMCGRRGPLYLITDYQVGAYITLGICRECYFSKDD